MAGNGINFNRAAENNHACLSAHPRLQKYTVNVPVHVGILSMS